MRGELVKTLTADGLWLHGFLIEPPKQSNFAIIHVHGHEGNFYENDFLSVIAELAVSKSFAFLTGNNRGSGRDMDFWNAGYSGYHRVGAERERFTDCVYDIGGWLSFMRQRGYMKFILEGHSYGGPKIAYAQWKQRDVGVYGLILLAATTLQTVHLPFFDFSRPESIQGLFSEISLPSLWVYGGGKDAFIVDPKAYFRVASIIPDADAHYLHEARHHFVGHYEELRQILDDWIDTLFSKHN